MNERNGKRRAANINCSHEGENEEVLLWLLFLGRRGANWKQRRIRGHTKRVVFKLRIDKGLGYPIIVFVLTFFLNLQIFSWFIVRHVDEDIEKGHFRPHTLSFPVAASFARPSRHPTQGLTRWEQGKQNWHWGQNEWENLFSSFPCVPEKMMEQRSLLSSLHISIDPERKRTGIDRYTGVNVGVTVHLGFSNLS